MNQSRTSLLPSLSTGLFGKCAANKTHHFNMPPYVNCELDEDTDDNELRFDGVSVLESLSERQNTLQATVDNYIFRFHKSYFME